MALEAKNINTIEDMQRFVEGCLNDMDFGISTKEETLNNLKDYTLRVIQLSASQKVDKSDRQLAIPDVSAMLPDLDIDKAEKLAWETDYAFFAVEEDGNEINKADAGAFFLEGYNYAKGNLR